MTQARTRRQRSRWPFLLAFAVLLGSVGLGAWFLTRDRDGGDIPPPAEVPPPQELDLALRYVPVYQLREQERECDRRGEPYVPSPVELVLGQPGIILRGPGGTTIPEPVTADVAGAPANAFLDFPGDPRRPGCQFERDARRLGEGLEPTVYARVAFEPGKPGMVLQYWAFYYFNDWNNTHEGDWEMVQLVFDAQSVEEAMAEGPEYAVYSQHGSGERGDWDSKKVQKVGDRPVVYVSAGSHASYFSPNTYIGLGEAGAGFGCDVALPPHRALDPRVVVFEDAEPGSPAQDAWLDFPGRWGQMLSWEFNGPTGPQAKRVWHEPISWAEGARSGSATLPGTSLLGIGAVQSFCDAVEKGSLLLRSYMRYPAVVGSSALLVGVLTTFAGGVVVRDALRTPRATTVSPGFLRRRRSLGEIIRLSLTIYSRYPKLFLGLTLVIIPVGIVLAGLQNWLLTHPPFDRLHWVLSGNEVSSLVVGLLAGGVASFAVYLFVVAGALAAVRLIDSGESPDLRTVYRHALRGAPAVILARLGTLLVLGLLGFSIIGLPLAVYLAVRWFFVEEAVMLDGESQWRAPGASSRVVEGQWFRALGRLLFFGIIGLLAGPVFALTILLVTNTDPELVNLLAGIFHVVVLPFTAIGLALAYCDLGARTPQPRLDGSASLSSSARETARRWMRSVRQLFEGRSRRK